MGDDRTKATSSIELRQRAREHVHARKLDFYSWAVVLRLLWYRDQLFKQSTVFDHSSDVTVG